MANLFQQYLTPPKSVMEFQAEYDQADARKQSLRQNALSLAVGQQQMEDGQRAREGENHLSRLMGAGGTPDQIAANLAQAGYGKQALAYTKQQQDLAKGKADATHVDAQTGKLKSETSKIDYEQREAKRQKAITDIAAFTDPQQAMTSLQLHIEAGDVDPQQGQMIMQTIPKNPADFPKWQVGMLQRIMSAKDSAGQIAPDANAQLQANTSVRTNAATNARVAADAAAGRQQSDRHFNARENREKAAPRGQVIQTDQGVMLVDPRTGQAQPVTANGEALQPKLRQLPAAVQKGIGENTAALRKVESALSELAAYPEAFGVKNYLGDTVRQRTDPKGIKARALTADIGSLKIHDRSGAAVTASETPRLKPFIPSTTDDPAAIKQKLELFRDEYKAIQDDLVSMYSREQGYRAGGGPAPAAPGAKPTLGQIFGE